MNTRTLIWLIGGLVAIVAIVGGAWYLSMGAVDSEGDTGKTSGGFFSFLNFGSNAGTGQTPEETGNTATPEETAVATVAGEKLRQLSKEPVAGVVATTTRAGVVARYIERGTGHVFDIKLETGEKIRESNTTIPRLQEALWLPGGEEVMLRYFDDTYELAETFAAKLLPEKDVATGTAPFTLDGTFLEQNIRSISPSQSEAKIAYISGSSSGGTLFTSKGNGTTKTQVFTSPLKEILLQWFKTDTFSITTKPSAVIPGFTYTIPAKGGSLEKIVGDKLGLTTLMSPSGERLLYAEAKDKGIQTSSYAIKTNDTITMPASTFPEKCVWSKIQPEILYCGVPHTIPSGDYPDAWYQGLISFSDELWSLDTKNGSATLLAIPKKEIGGIDLVQPTLTKDERFLVFINKKDSSLWAFDLK